MLSSLFKQFWHNKKWGSPTHPCAKCSWPPKKRVFWMPCIATMETEYSDGVRLIATPPNNNRQQIRHDKKIKSLINFSGTKKWKIGGSHLINFGGLKHFATFLKINNFAIHIFEVRMSMFKIPWISRFSMILTNPKYFYKTFSRACMPQKQLLGYRYTLLFSENL